MQGGGGLLYLCNQRTDRAAWVVARACGEWDSLVRWQSGKVACTHATQRDSSNGCREGHARGGSFVHTLVSGW
jgi:hypothetical protein